MKAEATVDVDNLAGFYNERYVGEYCSDHVGLDVELVRCLVREVTGPVQTILDYGCGSGGLIHLLEDVFPGAHITGVDISEKAVEKAREGFPLHRFLAFDGQKVTCLTDNSFDLIFSSHVLEHVKNVDDSASDISRLLKPGGYFCVTFPCGNEGSLEKRITDLIKGGVELSCTGERRFIWEEPGHLRRMTSGEVIQLFSAKGVSIEKEYYSNQFWGAVRWITAYGPVYINDMFAIRRGASFTAKVKLLSLKVLFLFLSPLFLGPLDLGKRIHKSRGVKRLVLFALLVPKAVVLPLWKVLDYLAYAEWRAHRARRNGSCQFLLFRKG